MTPRSTLAPLGVALALGLGLGASSKAPTQPTQAVAASAAPSPSPSPTGEPRTYDGAKAAVDRLNQAVAAHDGGTEWDMLTTSGQAAMTRADFIQLTKACGNSAAAEKFLSLAMDGSGSTATVTMLPAPGQGSEPYIYSMVYENGHWRHQPSDGAMHWMTMGATNAIAYLKAGGAC